MTLTPEEIAGRLTKAQRRALVRAEPDGKLGKFFIRWWVANGVVLRALKRKDLGFSVWSGLCLTPLGLAVRQHIEREGE